MNNDHRAAWMLVRLRCQAPPRRRLSGEAQAVYDAIDAMLAVLCSDAARWRVVCAALLLAYRVGQLLGRHRGNKR